MRHLILAAVLVIGGCSNPVAPEEYQEIITVELLPPMPDAYARIDWLKAKHDASCQRTGSYQGWVRVGFDWFLDEHRETWTCTYWR